MAVIREKRSVQDFDEVALQGIGELHIEQGEVEELVIEADESVLPHIRSEVLARRLELGPKNWLDGVFFVGARIVFHLKLIQVRRLLISGSGKVFAPSLRAQTLELKVSGSGEQSIDFVEVEDLTLSISGAGSLRLAGSANRTDLTISGSGVVRMRDLVSQAASVHVSGSGDVELDARRELDAQITGSGSVVYAGDPPMIRQRITGAGSIRRL